MDQRRSMHTTSGSLLARLRNPNEQEAWNRFADLYTPLLYYWVRRLGLTENDASDLVQEVFLVLVAKLPSFEYQESGSFRGWLRTLTINKYRESLRRKRLPMVAGLADLPAKDPRGQSEESEHRQYLVKQMLQIIKDEFPPSTWKYFQDSVVNDRDPQEVAAEYRVSIRTVYSAKSKVLARLREELAGLLDG
jgi:RNA polymerase sigma-70 factor (ECF subfamily)